mmetsp:Transcript_58315/g.142577  ORF Transcript_58315/g.142577 Transcript_58315/m.142577 type:complete len:492 (-) Transcript_58315:1079-2554(-)
MMSSNETPAKQKILTPRDVNVDIKHNSIEFSTPKPTTLTTKPLMTPKQHDDAYGTTTPMTKASAARAGMETPGTAARRTPGRGMFSPRLPLKQRRMIDIKQDNILRQQQQQQQQQQQKKKFESVCKTRVGEDHDGDLYDTYGIEEWSIDEFEYIQKLGNGGVGNVYLAREIQSGHMVALKVQFATDTAFLELDLHQEISDRTAINQGEDNGDDNGKDDSSKNILKLVDYFCTNEKFGPAEDEIPGESDYDDDEKQAYLHTILEFCEAGDLHGAVDLYGEVPEPIAAKYMMQCIQGLEHMHSKNIIHCDIKPGNVLLTKDDTVKLCDFGMSVRSTEKEVMGGSPVYMAPEHLTAWRHHSDDFDHRVDIYSLGIVMYELLLGYLPYDVIEAPKGHDSSSTDGTTPTTEDDDEDTEDDDGFDLGFPILDLRNLKDSSCNEHIAVPPPIFIDEISEEAEELIHRFLQPDRDLRITLAEAKQHKWFQKFLTLEYAI